MFPFKLALTDNAPGDLAAAQKQDFFFFFKYQLSFELFELRCSPRDFIQDYFYYCSAVYTDFPYGRFHTVTLSSLFYR